MFKRGAKATQWGKGGLFNKCCWNKWMPTIKQIKTPKFAPFPKLNLKWIIYLNVKHKIIQFSEDSIKENLGDLEPGDDFLDITPKAWSIKES